MIMAIHFAFMLVVAILRAEDGGANGASEMLNVVFAIQCCDVGASQSTSAFVAKQVKTSKIVGFAKRILALSALVVNREEFGGH